MNVDVKCPACDVLNKVEDELYGSEADAVFRNLIECRKCDEPFVVEFHVKVETVIRKVR